MFSRLTDREILLAADNAEPLAATDLQTALRERFAVLLAELDGLRDAGVLLYDNGIDPSKTSDLERTKRALEFDSQNDVDVVEKLITACADEDIYSADDFRRLAERAKLDHIQLVDAGLAS